MSARKLRRSGEKGSILVMTAVSLTALMGITALAIDTSLLFDTRHRMDAAADAAAMAAALEYFRNKSDDAALTEFAKHDIALHNFNTATDFTQLFVRHCNAAGSTCDATHSSNSNYVEVILTRDVPMFFMRLFGRSTMTVSARSVAGLGISPYCLISLASTKTKKDKTEDIKDAVKLDKDASMIAPGCYVQVNSKADGKGDALTLDTSAEMSVDGGQIGVAGTWNHKGKVSPTPTEGAPPIVDPLAQLEEPPYGSCAAKFTVDKGKTESLAPGCYDGIEVKEEGTLNLTGPGIYVLTDNLKTKDPGAGKWTTITDNGSHVLIYTIANKKVEFTPNVKVTLSAQTSGKWAGILFFGARAGDKVAAKFNDDAEYDLKGVIYYPNGDIEFGNKKKKKSEGGTLETDCTVFIGRKIKFSKRSDLMNTCSEYESSALHTVSVAENP